jgi:hypothetical protein
MFDAALITEIVTLGAIALAITQAVKTWLKWDGTKAILLSAVVCILLALWKVLTAQPIDWGRSVILLVGTFLESNGIYQFGSYAIGGKSLNGSGGPTNGSVK